MTDITYVLNSRWPTIKAYGLQVAKTCEGFKRAGAKVRLVIPLRARHKELRGMDPFDVYGVTDRFRVIRLPSLDFTRIHLNGRIFFLIQQILFAAVAAVTVMFKRTVVYSRDPFTLYFLYFTRRPLYWEMHRVPDDLGRGMYRTLLSRCAGIVCITEGIRQRLLKAGVASERLLVAPDGIDIDEFNIPETQVEAQKLLGLNPSLHQVVYTGQLFDWKGVSVLIDAAKLLDDRFHVTIVGGTAEEVAELRRAHKNERLTLEPFQPHSRIPLWLRAADTVVLPNRRDGGISEFYTSPLKMFEYMAAGKRIVASDLPSIREVLNEQNSILVRPDDARALADGIIRSAADEVGSGRLALQARDDVRRYTWKQRAESIVSFIGRRGISH